MAGKSGSSVLNTTSVVSRLGLHGPQSCLPKQTARRRQTGANTTARCRKCHNFRSKNILENTPTSLLFSHNSFWTLQPSYRSTRSFALKTCQQNSEHQPILCFYTDSNPYIQIRTWASDDIRKVSPNWKTLQDKSKAPSRTKRPPLEAQSSFFQPLIFSSPKQKPISSTSRAKTKSEKTRTPFWEN